MKKVLIVLLLFVFMACGDSLGNDSSKKDFKKISVSHDETGGGSGGGDGTTNPPPGGGG